MGCVSWLAKRDRIGVGTVLSFASQAHLVGSVIGFVHWAC